MTCKAENTTITEIDVCLRHLGTVPDMYENCYIDCEQDCIFTEWSEWNSCVGRCQNKQFRSRKLVGERTAPAKCKKLNRYISRPCVCSQLEPVVIGNWSECILDPPRSRRLILSHLPGTGRRSMRNATNPEMGITCGTGKQYKIMACQNSFNAMETAEKCTVAGQGQWNINYIIIVFHFLLTINSLFSLESNTMILTLATLSITSMNSSIHCFGVN